MADIYIKNKIRTVKSLGEKIGILKKSIEEFLNKHNVSICEIDIRDLEKLLSFDRLSVELWMPRQIRDLMRSHGIWLQKDKGSTAVRMRLHE